MTREQCKYCGRHSYRDGKCYADRKLKGLPISEIVYCRLGHAATRVARAITETDKT